MPGALSTHQVKPSLHVLYEINWNKDAITLLYNHLKQQYNLRYVSSINILPSTFDVNLAIGEKYSTMNATEGVTEYTGMKCHNEGKYQTRYFRGIVGHVLNCWCIKLIVIIKNKRFQDNIFT